MIRGIDTQIMINNSFNASNEASTIQQRPEVNQHILAEQQKTQSAQDQSRVGEISEAEMEEIRTEEDESGSGGYDGRGGKHPGENNEDEDSIDITMYVPPSNNILDIMV